MRTHIRLLCLWLAVLFLTLAKRLAKPAPENQIAIIDEADKAALKRYLESSEGREKVAEAMGFIAPLKPILEQDRTFAPDINSECIP